jgi:hypothetical protein
MLEATKQHAAKLRAEIGIREREIGELSDRIKALGGDVLEAHKSFVGDGPQ